MKNPVDHSAKSNDPIPTFTMSNPQGDIGASLLAIPSVMFTSNSPHSGSYGTGAVGADPVTFDQKYSYGDTLPLALRNINKLNITRNANGQIDQLLQSGLVVSNTLPSEVNRSREQLSTLQQQVGTSPLAAPPQTVFYGLPVVPQTAANPRVNSLDQMKQQLQNRGQ